MVSAVTIWCHAILLLSTSLLAAAGATFVSSETLTPTPSTIVDYLSSDVSFTYFLRALQRGGSIPILNRLENITLFAPINSAYALDDPDMLEVDSETLMKYIVDQKVQVKRLGKSEAFFPSRFYKNGVQLPIKISADLKRREYVVDDRASIIEPDLHVKHQHSFIQAVDKLLPTKPSFCELMLNDESPDVDGYSVSIMKKLLRSMFLDAKSRSAAPGSAADAFALSLPEFTDGSVAETQVSKRAEKKKKKAARRLPPTCQHLFNDTKTFFLPTDDYIRQSLSDLELAYYLSLYDVLIDSNSAPSRDSVIERKADVLALLHALMIPDIVGGLNGTSFATNTSHRSIGHCVTYNASIKDEKVLKLSSARGDVLSSGHSVSLSDGVIHLFDIAHNTGFYKETNRSAETIEPSFDKTSTSPLGFFSLLYIPIVPLIPRKVLYAINYSSFVEELEFRSLGSLIDGSTSNQTLFLDLEQNDFINDETSDSVQFRSFSSKQSFLYQFADGYWDFSKCPPEDGLIESRLCPSRLVASCLKIKLSHTEKDASVLVNDDSSVIEGPYHCTNSTALYITDAGVSPPQSLKHTLTGLLSADSHHLERVLIDKETCFHTLQLLMDTKLLSLKSNHEGYTIFLPCSKHTSSLGSNDQYSNKNIWESLGLVYDYLRAHPKKLKHVLASSFITETFYSDLDFEPGTVVKSINFNGDQVSLQIPPDGRAFGHDDFITSSCNRLLVNNTEISIPPSSDIFFNQGVIHSIDKLLLPDDFEIALGDLIGITEDFGAPGVSILALLNHIPFIANQLGLGNSLSGRSISNYSLLAPTPQSLSNLNITAGYNDLLHFLKLHIIPNDQLASLVACLEGSEEKNSIRTNLTGVSLTCSLKQGSPYLALESSGDMEESSHEVKLISHGCTSGTFYGHHNNASCVFLLENALQLNWLNSPGDHYLHIHIGILNVAVGVLVGILCSGALFYGFFLRISSSRRSKNATKSTTSLNEDSPSSASSFIRVTPGLELPSRSNGYETDTEGPYKSDREPLFSSMRTNASMRYGSVDERDRRRQKRVTKISSSKEIPKSSPRNIKGNGVKKTGVERDLPF